MKALVYCLQLCRVEFLQQPEQHISFMMASVPWQQPQEGGPNKVQVTILASEWGSSKGGLSTINRELAIQLAKFTEVHITYFLPKCSDEEKNEACHHGITVLEATPRLGYEELDWLSFPPEDLRMDFIVGHGVKLGHQAQLMRKSHKCKWMQMVHTDPEELGMFKCYENPISKGEEKHNVEVELCKMANFVLAVGPKLAEAFRKYLRSCKKDQDVFELTPGIFDEFVSAQQVPEERKQCSVLVFGCGDAEDFKLKGFDIAARSVAALPDAYLLFVGAPDGKHEEIANRLLEWGIPRHHLKVRGYITSREALKGLFCEVDLLLMPSRTEGFGLTGLEALSAGLPVIVSKNSGFGEALGNVPFGSSFVIGSEDPNAWTAAIKDIWNKNRQTRLEEAKVLRDYYATKYNWSEQCKDLLEKMISSFNDGDMASVPAAFPTTRESPNYARLCRLLVDVGSQALRDTFDRIHPSATLCHVLSNHSAAYSTLQSLRRKGVLNATQWGKLYPTVSSSVSSATFDITLLLVLLRNICGLSPPASTGSWDELPPSHDNSPEANIARIKFYRNDVYAHASHFCVDDATFNTLWQDISNAVLALGSGTSFASAINRLKTECMDPDVEEHYQKLLKEWKKDDDNTKETLKEVKEMVGELKEILTQVKRQEGDTKDKFGKIEERPSVKGATSHTPETESPSRSVKVASDPLHQSRHHSSSALEPSHVRDSYKPEGRLPERRSVSPLQNDGNTQVEVSSSGSGGTQKQLIDLAVFGCNVLENSMQVVKEVLGRLRSQLHISSQIIENYSPVKVRSCLEERAARICVLLVDAETVSDAYRNLPRRRMEYEDLFKTAADTVAEKVIVVIFAPCSLPSKKDEVVVKEAIEAILLATGKGLVLWVKDKPITPEVLEEKIMSSIRSQEFPNSGDSRPTSVVEHRSKLRHRTVYDPLKAHSSQQLYPYGYDRDQNQSQQRMSMQSRGPPSVYRDFSTMKGFVMLKTRLRFGQISKHHGDVEIFFPGFVVAPDTERNLLQEHWKIAEAVVEIASDGNGGFCATIEAQSERKEKPVQLSQNETVMLKTRLRDGQISMQQGDLKFLYPQWQIPSYIIQSLSEEYRFHSDVELYIISDEKGHLRTQVKTYRKDRVSGAFKKVFK
ncbi:uncharacterized protein [Montipora capricornis]|uniref:uncharacterized protein isoform X3 n=1 Tax=Montipora capricornis TaxID=246305 RepID=UPI0035F15186